MSAASQSKNSFDLIRLAAALLVLWSHHYAVNGLPQPGTRWPQTSLGGFGVYVFFAISGYLNFISVSRRRDAINFLLARVLRIYPAMLICTPITIVAGFAFTTESFDRWFFGFEAIEFIRRDSLLIFEVLWSMMPGVFAGNPMPGVMNNSIWTIPYELVMYILLAFFASLFAYHRSIAPIGLVTFLYLTLSWNGDMNTYRIIAPLQIGPLYQFGFIFFVGATTASIEAERSFRSAIMVVIAIAVGLSLSNQVNAACLAVLAGTTVWVGKITLPPALRLPRDISYGTYLYAFPIQQMAVAVTHNFWLSFVIAVPFTLMMGYMSNKFIELPAMKLAARGQAIQS